MKVYTAVEVYKWPEPDRGGEDVGCGAKSAELYGLKAGMAEIGVLVVAPSPSLKVAPTSAALDVGRLLVVADEEVSMAYLLSFKLLPAFPCGRAEAKGMAIRKNVIN